MTGSLVECIPNFSEARRPEVVEAIVSSIRKVPGVAILDQHSDLDHNRTVITYVGTADAVSEAAFQAIQTASQLIDLNQHKGEHPRIGATDVVPFVPISETSMADCVELARRLGKRVADELEIPVYLYEAAATRPERQNLETIRQGEFENLKTDIISNPDRKPDFGPSILGKAGATVIGARQPLIAFNVYLTSNDVTIAKNIARTIRNSSGGLRFVKALGLLVEGRAQVSMNLTNFHQTPVARVVEMIRREAMRYGTTIDHSELVGLVPQEAFLDASAWYLQLDGFDSTQILETRLKQVLTAETKTDQISVEDHNFLNLLAAGTPTPGGGSAAAYAGAASAALVAMVARLTVGKKKYTDVEPQMWDLIEKADKIRSELTAAITMDAEAFEAILQAMRLPKDSPAEVDARNDALEKATRRAIEVPTQVARLSLSAMEMALKAATLGNLNAITDAASASSLARAALTAAGLNVRANLLNLKEEAFCNNFLSEVRIIEKHAAELESTLSQILGERGKLPLP